MKDKTLTSHVVMDIRIHAVTMEEAVAFAEKQIMEGKPSMIATANAEMMFTIQITVLKASIFSTILAPHL